MGGDGTSKQRIPRFEHRETAALPRIVPFALSMASMALESGRRWVSGLASAAASDHPLLSLGLYPVRTALVLGALVFFSPAYQELRGKVWADWQEALLTLGVGVLVSLVWIRLAWPWAMHPGACHHEPAPRDTRVADRRMAVVVALACQHRYLA